MARTSEFVLGTTQAALNKLWQSMSYHAVSSSPPEEKGRAVVDIDCKCHINKAEGKDGTGAQPEDWFDGFEIVSKKGSNESKAKSYQLQLGNWKRWNWKRWNWKMETENGNGRGKWKGSSFRLYFQRYEAG